MRFFPFWNYHAAAFVLVGWYLMVPPINRYTDIHGSYDSADACGEGKITQWKDTLAAAKEEASNPALRDGLLAVAARVMTSVCVSTDDPRLAK